MKITVDGSTFRKLAIRLSTQINTGVDYLLSIPVMELRELAKEVVEIGKERERLRAENKNHRKR